LAIRTAAAAFRSARCSYDAAVRALLGGYAKPEVLNFPENWLQAKEYLPKAAS
jgi:hypothetical protein